MGEAAVEMARSHVQGRPVRGGEKEFPTRFEQPAELAKGRDRIRHVLQNLGAKYGIEAGVRQRDLDEVANMVDGDGVFHQRTFVLAKVLVLVLAMGEEWGVFTGASPGIQNAAAGRQSGGFGFY